MFGGGDEGRHVFISSLIYMVMFGMQKAFSVTLYVSHLVPIGGLMVVWPNPQPCSYTNSRLTMSESTNGYLGNRTFAINL